jgi:hypothetical protein
MREAEGEKGLELAVELRFMPRRRGIWACGSNAPGKDESLRKNYS